VIHSLNPKTEFPLICSAFMHQGRLLYKNTVQVIAHINKGIWGWVVTQHLASVLTTCFNNMERYHAGKAHGHPGFLTPHPVGTFLAIFRKKSPNLQVSE